MIEILFSCKTMLRNMLCNTRKILHSGMESALGGAALRRLADQTTVRKLGFKNIAGWSSLAARVAHNHEVVGSNPTPATSYPETRSAKRTA